MRYCHVPDRSSRVRYRRHATLSAVAAMTPTDHDTEYDADEGEGLEAPSMSGGVAGIIPLHRRKAVYALLGVAILIGSIGAFYTASAAFDDRVPVVVSVGTVEEGALFSATDLGRAEALVDGIAHIGWTSGIEESLAGFVATANIEPGTLMHEGLFMEPDPLTPPSDSIEIQLRLAAFPTSAALVAEQTVLVIAEGVSPGDTEGKPRRVVGPPLAMRHWDGSILHIYPSPDEWYDTLTNYTSVGVLQALAVEPDHAEAIAAALTEGWQRDWEQAKADVGFAPPAGGDLDMVLPLDLALTPTAIANGDTVLIIDGGSVDAAATDARPPRVLEHRTLDGWDAANSSLRLFGLTPSDWVYYRSLLDGEDPFVLRVSDDVEWLPEVPCDSCPGGVRIGRLLDELVTGMVQDWEQRRHDLPEDFFDRLTRDDAEETVEDN